MINIFSKYFKKAAALSAGCFFMYSCENSMQEVRNLGIHKPGKEVAENVQSYMSQDGKIKAKLTAPLMYRTQSDTPITEFPKTLKVDFYGDSAKLESKLFAKYGRYMESEGKVLLKDSVVVFNVKGDTMLTNELWWDRNKAIFYTDKYVLIKKPMNQHFEGKDGLTADQSFKSWTLLNSSGITNVPDSSMPAN
ncbi:LPS export ABC transporter periplasmic protein LptC [Limnovirga soli]|jgi:LPS export ABC transporter protein LptC|uniref:LPS export ABC transporter periplasmic protein LptC n=1 Tax=Limnovirga soli TaxID=2656915 RepID=A0A8J8JX50_9BACT|nr:LPS export ABC transporter periplasmic protein LptC [Limnovirga soli]NNV56001.1 LPS export ABC transporter periplasmic protein LptC [Limnovirga soli]